MYQFDRVTQPELELYTLTNLNSGEEFTVTLQDMKDSIYSEFDVLKMLSSRHPDFMLVKKEREVDFPNAGIAFNF